MTDDALSDDDLVVATPSSPVAIVPADVFAARLESMIPEVEDLVAGFAAGRIRMTDADERARLVDLRERSRAISEALRLVERTIERVFAAYAADIGATTVALGEGRRPVLIEKPRAEYVTQAEPLRRELLRISALDGAPTREEIESAVKVVVDHKPDHRILNAMATKYGGEVAAAIAQYRTRPDVDLAAGRVRFPE